MKKAKFNPHGFAAISKRAVEHEENGEWAKAAEVWKRAMRTNCSMTNWKEANRRRGFCRRKVNQQRYLQREAV